jgi:hypothetical protein
VNIDQLKLHSEFKLNRVLVQFAFAFRFQDDLVLVCTDAKIFIIILFIKHLLNIFYKIILAQTV